MPAILNDLLTYTTDGPVFTYIDDDGKCVETEYESRWLNTKRTYDESRKTKVRTVWDWDRPNYEYEGNAATVTELIESNSWDAIVPDVLRSANPDPLPTYGETPGWTIVPAAGKCLQCWYCYEQVHVLAYETYQTQVDLVRAMLMHTQEHKVNNDQPMLTTAFGGYVKRPCFGTYSRKVIDDNNKIKWVAVHTTDCCFGDNAPKVITKPTVIRTWTAPDNDRVSNEQLREAYEDQFDNAHIRKVARDKEADALALAAAKADREFASLIAKARKAHGFTA